MVVESSSSARGTQESMAFAQRSLENSLSLQVIMDSLSASQGSVEHLLLMQWVMELYRATKSRVENVLFPESPRSVVSQIFFSGCSYSQEYIGSKFGLHVLSLGV